MFLRLTLKSRGISLSASFHRGWNTIPGRRIQTLSEVTSSPMAARVRRLPEPPSADIEFRVTWIEEMRLRLMEVFRVPEQPWTFEAGEGWEILGTECVCARRQT